MGDVDRRLAGRGGGGVRMVGLERRGMRADSQGDIAVTCQMRKFIREAVVLLSGHF